MIFIFIPNGLNVCYNMKRQCFFKGKEFCMKCYKLKDFRMVFHLLKYYQDQNLQFQLCH